MFRKMFDSHYPDEDKSIPYYWLPKWCGDVKEASARVLNCYSNSDDLAKRLGGDIED